MNLVQQYNATERVIEEPVREEIGAARFFFHIGITPEYEFVYGSPIYVVIVSEQFWNENHHIADSYTEEEEEILNPILERIGLMELMDSTYEIDGLPDGLSINRQVEYAMRLMLNAGFRTNPELDLFLNGGQ